MTVLRTDVPTGAMAPSVIDNYMRDDKAAWQERLNVDHDFTLAASVIRTVADGAGKHRQVTLPESAAAPSAGTNEGVLYVADVAGVSEVWYDGDGMASALQITSGGALNVTLANVVAHIDTETIYQTAGNKIAVQLDDTTLEYDAVAKVRIKTVPTAGTDADNAGSPVYSAGSYTGANPVTVQIGIVPRFMVIRRAGGNTVPVVLINYGGTLDVCGAGEGSNYSANFSLVGTALTISNTNAAYNAVGVDFCWSAFGDRS